MEVTYGAALHLMMAKTLFAHAIEGEEYGEKAHSILDEMISKGNRLASSRKIELTHLEGLFNELAVRIKQYGLQELLLTTPDHIDQEANMQQQPNFHHLSHMDESAAHLHSPDTYDMHGYQQAPRMPNGVELLDDIGISSYEFLSIIEQIGADNSVLDPTASPIQGIE
ncbi:hypothetical protein N7478_001711 [Penicillium angulare]|uniref:uncharacterized protein n=1 Tax=Penicillium angulare TaxID=116970 RepID=UPI002541E31E|nr:uncharacterized protein N7478_001711 [Penicillium angulare]KAJ5288681.1 hypothetical protein N7478_001711 [Penicillium angulare]